VRFTRLCPLRGNNLVYSPFWRLFFQGLGAGGPYLLDHLLGNDQRSTVLTFLDALKAKPNQRKVVIADEPGDHVTHLTSSNVEGSSSYFVNVARVSVDDLAVTTHVAEADADDADAW
jgi:hypothetical protein